MLKAQNFEASRRTPTELEIIVLEFTSFQLLPIQFSWLRAFQVASERIVFSCEPLNFKLDCRDRQYI
jgi:hypothetical protein